MEPAFYDNDRVITFNFGNIKTGSVVVFKLGELKLIKRVRKLESDSLLAISDNKKFAKKEFRVEKKDIIGRVVLRYSNSQ